MSGRGRLWLWLSFPLATGTLVVVAVTLIALHSLSEDRFKVAAGGLFLGFVLTQLTRDNSRRLLRKIPLMSRQEFRRALIPHAIAWGVALAAAGLFAWLAYVIRP